MSAPAVNTKKPLIVVTLDSEQPGGYSKYPWYALRQNYCDVIAEAGGIPVPVPHQADFIQDYAHLVDGFVFTGGDFDIDPALYGVADRHETVKLKPNRTDFEGRLFTAAYALKKPILGICGGMQLMNVCLKGTLIQHVPAEVPNCLAHEQPNPRCEPGHTIQIHNHTLLHRLVKERQIDVNSAHHQAVKAVASGFIVNALAPDGVIEGIEDTNHPFCLGVQWHPEFHITDADRRIFQGLVQAATVS